MEMEGCHCTRIKAQDCGEQDSRDGERGQGLTSLLQLIETGHDIPFTGVVSLFHACHIAWRKRLLCDSCAIYFPTIFHFPLAPNGS